MRLFPRGKAWVWPSCFGRLPRRNEKVMRRILRCLNATELYLAVENPIPMRLAQLPRPSCYADPSWFGVKYTKKTCYWLKNLPPIMPGTSHPHPRSYVNSSRGKYRSRTFPPIARAIAKQWSAYILDDMQRARKTTVPVTDATPTDPP